jgi:hypothetical protein
MEKMCCEVKVIETDEGYRIEVKGEKDRLKAEYGECCGDVQPDCCPDGVMANLETKCCRVNVSETAEGFDVNVAGDKTAIKDRLRRVCQNCCGRCC